MPTPVLADQKRTLSTESIPDGQTYQPESAYMTEMETTAAQDSATNTTITYTADWVQNIDAAVDSMRDLASTIELPTPATEFLFNTCCQ